MKKLPLIFIIILVIGMVLTPEPSGKTDRPLGYDEPLQKPKFQVEEGRPIYMIDWETGQIIYQDEMFAEIVELLKTAKFPKHVTSYPDMHVAIEGASFRYNNGLPKMIRVEGEPYNVIQLSNGEYSIEKR